MLTRESQQSSEEYLRREADRIMTLNFKTRLSLAPSFQSLVPGFSSCLRCGLPWPAVRDHSTRYTENSGCFPLCEACWQELGTPEARWPFYEKLIAGWQVQGAKNVPVDAIRRAVMDGG